MEPMSGRRFAAPPGCHGRVGAGAFAGLGPQPAESFPVEFSGQATSPALFLIIPRKSVAA